MAKPAALRRAVERIHLALERLNFSRRVELLYLNGQMRRRLDGVRPLRGVDIACGLGSQTTLIADAFGARLVGIDWNRRVAALAAHEQASANVDFLVGDSASLPLVAARCDFAVSVCAFEHFHDDRAAFREAARVTRPGGWFFLTVDSLNHPAVSETYRSRHRKICAVEQYYTAEALRAKLEEAGFEVADVEYLLRGRLAGFLSGIGISTDFGRPYLLLSALLYPLVRLEEALRRGAYGYKLGAAARRTDRPPTRSSSPGR